MKNETLTAAGITRSQVGIFTRQDLAESSACETGGKPQRVILGEGGEYWVVSARVAARLESLGYEYAS